VLPSRTTLLPPVVCHELHASKRISIGFEFR
jgi:hypothetical protein